MARAAIPQVSSLHKAMSQPDRPHLILITTDQQRFDALGVSGNHAIYTPHLDYLARRGTRFTRCYSDAPVCGPARATIMTGQHGWAHGQTSNSVKVSPMHDRPTLPGVLTQHGYQTRAVGKMHFLPVRARYGFEEAEILPDYYRWLAAQPGAKPAKAHGLGENELEPGFATTDEHLTVTNWTAQRAINFLETRDPTRPFFLWISFSKPHPPLDPPRSYWDIYDGIPMPKPRRGDWAQTWEDVPRGYLEPTFMLNGIHRFSPEKLRNTRRAYYALISQVDYSLGLILARLRELNLREDTTIVFTSDHGEMLGDHHMGAKSVLLEGSGHVPLIITPGGKEWERKPGEGETDNRIACLADIMPTLLHFAKAPIPDHLNGLDLRGETERDHLIGECVGYHAIISSEGAYHWTERGGQELAFRLDEDPEETHALPSDNPWVVEQRDRLTEALERRHHRAVQNGNLTGSQPVLGPEQIPLWPGFHSTGDEDCDLLH